MKQGKILIVDDNEDILFTLKMLLRPLAEKVTTLSDPCAMLPLLSRVRHDVILLDMNFRDDAVSGREGFAWLEEILKLDPQASVVFITAYSDTEKAVRAIKQGATDFIPKPWQNDKLLATVSSALQLCFERRSEKTLFRTTVGKNSLSCKIFYGTDGTNGRINCRAGTYHREVGCNAAGTANRRKMCRYRGAPFDPGRKRYRQGSSGPIRSRTVVPP